VIEEDLVELGAVHVEREGGPRPAGLEVEGGGEAQLLIVEGGAVLHLEAVREHPVEHAQPAADVHARRDEGFADLEAREGLALARVTRSPPWAKGGSGAAARPPPTTSTSASCEDLSPPASCEIRGALKPRRFAASGPRASAAAHQPGGEEEVPMTDFGSCRSSRLEGSSRSWWITSTPTTSR
jgi:hypothetical protein